MSFASGSFYRWFYLKKDSYQPAPRRPIVLTFGLDCLATISTGIVEVLVLGDSFLDEGASLGGIALGMLFVVGPVEDACKSAAVHLPCCRSRG